jgi:hypothetical protein
MSTDKRTVATDALETLGTIIDDKAGRDAIHLAVEPVIAAQKLRPGQHVGFVEGGVGLCDKPVGIVDPFIDGVVKRGQRFWLVVYPRQITSLRHVWTHPAFGDEPKPFSGVDIESNPFKTASEMWIRSFALTLPVHYEDLMEHAQIWLDSGGHEYWIEGGRFEGEGVPKEFWTHYQNVTGTVVPEDKQWSFLSCSC